MQCPLLYFQVPCHFISLSCVSFLLLALKKVPWAGKKAFCQYSSQSLHSLLLFSQSSRIYSASTKHFCYVLFLQCHSTLFVYVCVNLIPRIPSVQMHSHFFKPYVNLSSKMIYGLETRYLIHFCFINSPYSSLYFTYMHMPVVSMKAKLIGN